MPVSHSLKCIFVHIPRTGGTSIENALGMFSDSRCENTDSMFGMIRSPLLKTIARSSVYLQHIRAHELQQLLPDQFQTYFRFAFVRNPWDRTVSQYCYVRRKAGISFDEFLEETEGSEHSHVAPQHAFIVDSHGVPLVDFIGRFEQLASDFAEVCARLGIERALPHLNFRVHGPYRSYYDEASRKLVERRYGEDIERFRYSF